MNADISLPGRHRLCHRDSKSLVRAARALRGRSQAALGEAIGRDRSWISRLESGDVMASPTEKAKISQVLGIPSESFFPEDEED